MIIIKDQNHKDMSTRNKKRQQDSSKSPRWENQRLDTHEKKWLDEELIKLPYVDCSEGIDQKILDKVTSRVLLAMKFKSDNWESLLNDSSKRSSNKFKKFEEYVYLHLNRAEPAEDQIQQSTQPTIEQSQVADEASAEIPDS